MISPAPINTSDPNPPFPLSPSGPTGNLPDTSDDIDLLPEASSSRAPFHTYPKHTYTSVEYPGPVSHPSAILRLIDQQDINECFNTQISDPKMLEMKYKKDDRYGIPVRGLRVGSSKLLLKVVRKRRKKVVEGDLARNEDSGDENGVFMADIIGPVNQTVRFRAMADYHYTPNQDGRIAGIISMLTDLDYESILDYEVPPFDETYIEPLTPPPEGEEDKRPIKFRSLLDLQPSPMFSEKRIPQVYSYKNHSQAVVENVEDPFTGEVKQRYVNKGRFQGYTPPVIGHKNGVVPTEPIKAVKDKIPKLDPELFAKLQKLFEERPVWQRHSLMSQFTEAEQKEVQTRQRPYIPAVTYAFGAGPYWKCLVRLGYDPRTDPDAYRLQRVYFYLFVGRAGLKNPVYRDETPDAENEDGTEAKRAQWEAEQVERAAEGKRPPIDKTCDYIFDGKVLHRDKPDYQLCDVTDPLIMKYVNDPANRQDVCDVQNGWYRGAAFTLIKALIRIKYSYVREHNEPAPDRICYEAIETQERLLLEGDGGASKGDEGIDED